jgi:alkylhydroperoxidase family enzyme
MREGLTEDRIAALEDYQDSNLHAAGKIALRFEQMALNHHALDDEFFRQLRTQFTDAQIVELGMMIAQYIGVGRLLMVLDLERPVCTL